MARHRVPHVGPSSATARGAALATLLLLAGACAGRQPVPASPQQAADGLLAADRAFSAASARTDLASGISAMLADDVTMPLPGGGFAEGRARAAEALRAVPGNADARAEWAPIRGGVSADGRHGFTFGYMTQHRADGTRAPLRYLAYWVRGADGWRVAVYKRVRRPADDAPVAMAPALPARMVPPTTDAAAIDAHRRSLDAAERAFSDDAQRIGLGPAFARYGSADAVNMGGAADTTFVLGAESIARAVSRGVAEGTSPVTWAPERVLVASSGDLGVTIGFIRPRAPAAGGPTASPFFTIWRRASPDAPWRYVAE